MYIKMTVKVTAAELEQRGSTEVMFFICITLVQRSRQKTQSGDAKVGT